MLQCDALLAEMNVAYRALLAMHPPEFPLLEWRRGVVANRRDYFFRIVAPASFRALVRLTSEPGGTIAKACAKRAMNEFYSEARRDSRARVPVD